MHNQKILETLEQIQTGLSTESRSKLQFEDVVNHDSIDTYLFSAELPPAFASALLNLSNKEAIFELRLQLMKVFEAEGMSDEQDEARDRLYTDFLLANWDLDQELHPYQDFTKAQLWEALGLKNTQRIPGLSPYYDDGCEYNSWATYRSAEGTNIPWWQDPALKDRVKDLQPRAHQLVGVIKMLKWMVNKEGGLIADEVGVGKTPQTIIALVMRMAIIDAQKAGKFHHHDAMGKCLLLPDECY